VVETSRAVSLDVLTTTQFTGFSHGFGDALHSIGADSGVGNVDVVMAVVAADLGVVKDAESGVKGVLVRGESSGLAGRIGASLGVFAERSRLADICFAKRGAGALEVGMTSGLNILGDNGCRVSCPGRCGCGSPLLLQADLSSGLSSATCVLPDAIVKSAR
jgi:hypothetical protein